MSILTLTACSNTWEGVRADSKDVTRWSHNKTSSMEKIFGPAPTGYTGNSKPAAAAEKTQPPSSEAGGALNPAADAATQPATAGQQPSPRTRSNKGLVWHKIDNYDEGYQSAPTENVEPVSPSSPQSSAAPAIKYNQSVNVFPVDGDAEPYTQMTSGGFGNPAANNGYATVSGAMVQQIFFAHASARVSKTDRGNLQQLAEALVHSTDSYGLSVVGHASKRVDHVRDPIERKMINFKMAQKRANTVTTELRKAGMDPRWILASSRGDEDPNVKHGNKTQEAADRRAEVFVTR